MVDPLSVSALIVSSMQFYLQWKTHLLERKRRKRQEQEQLQLQQQQYMPLHPYPPQFYASLPSSPMFITYCICRNQPYPPSYYNHPVHYIEPAPSFPLPPVRSGPYPSSSPASYSRSVEPSSFTHYHDASLISNPSIPLHDRLGLLGGHIELHHLQQAPLMNSPYAHGTIGMRTGACAYNNHFSSYHHWKSLLEESSQGMQRSIAVVDWRRDKIDMFMEIRGAYFRNYRVSGCNVATFAHLFKKREVFSGEIKEQKLERFNKEMKVVEIRSGVRSTNSWKILGINDESEDMQEVLSEHKSFIQTIRGAVFGLVCCLYEAPSDLNVGIEAGHVFGHLDIVRISTHQPMWRIVKRDACLFSVFSFGDYGWAAQDILIG